MTPTDGKFDLELALIHNDLAEAGASSAASRAQRLAALSLATQRGELARREAELTERRKLAREQKKLTARAARLARREAELEARTRYWAAREAATR